YGLVDGGCSSLDVRFTVAVAVGAGGHTVRTKVQRVFGRHGPQVVCARLRGLRAGGRYSIRLTTSRAGVSRAARRVLRAVASGRRPRAQEGCA
ncbi:MAG TPA: hypothetical protein VGO80_02855, partial [Solirubrobacteraceae bacterium]|nr:hypothetical protein [Solirubrobacteraceae bacterium]